jgi:hypothetical protein
MISAETRQMTSQSKDMSNNKRGSRGRNQFIVIVVNINVNVIVLVIVM